jgi:hypothetical protein
VAQVLLAEELVLLGLDPRTDLVACDAFANVGVGGALLVDLAAAGVLDIPEGSHVRNGPAVRVVGEVDDPLLARVLASVAAAPAAAYDMIERLGMEFRAEVFERLAERRLLYPAARTSRRPTGEEWVAAGPGVGQELQEKVAEALLRDKEPDARVAVLITLFEATNGQPPVPVPNRRAWSAAAHRCDAISLLVTTDERFGVAVGRATRAAQFVAWTPPIAAGGASGS